MQKMIQIRKFQKKKSKKFYPGIISLIIFKPNSCFLTTHSKLFFFFQPKTPNYNLTVKIFKLEIVREKNLIILVMAESERRNKYRRVRLTNQRNIKSRLALKIESPEMDQKDIQFVQGKKKKKTKNHFRQPSELPQAFDLHAFEQTKQQKQKTINRKTKLEGNVSMRRLKIHIKLTSKIVLRCSAL